MKVFRVAHVITRLCKGGAQENTFHTVRLANRDRFEVDLISGPTEGREGSIEDAVGRAGIAITRVPDLVREAAPLRDWRALCCLEGIFQERRYDIVHTHTSKAGFLGRLAAARTGVPIIVHTPHGNIFDGYFSKPVTRLFVAMERYAARRTDRIIELTPGGIEAHLQEGIGWREQFVTIFSGIDLTPYSAALERREKTRRNLGVEPGIVLAGGVGRLEPVKGFTYLVAAARKALTMEPRMQFVVAGQGALEEVLRGEAADLGDRFRFLGLREDVPELMAALDVFVLASVNEGMGRVLLEAGAAGVASVATRVGGVPDIIMDGETGILTPPRDSDVLADAMVRLARDPVLRRAMGEAARKAVVPRYGLENMVRQIESLYEELIREKCLDA